MKIASKVSSGKWANEALTGWLLDEPEGIELPSNANPGDMMIVCKLKPAAIAFSNYLTDSLRLVLRMTKEAAVAGFRWKGAGCGEYGEDGGK